MTAGKQWLQFFFTLSLVSAAAAPLNAAAPAPFAVILRHADEDGLVPSDYRSEDAVALADYARDLATGRPGLRLLDSDVALPPPQFDRQAVVEGALRGGDIAKLPDQLAPPFPEYAFLKAQLARYRAIAAAGDWPQLKGLE